MNDEQISDEELAEMGSRYSSLRPSEVRRLLARITSLEAENEELRMRLRGIAQAAVNQHPSTLAFRLGHEARQALSHSETKEP